MSIYQTITFQPWTIGALDRSKHAMVFCSTQEGPIFRAHTWNEQVELYRAPSHEKIAQYYTGSGPGVALNLITVPSPTVAGKKLLTTHSPCVFRSRYCTAVRQILIYVECFRTHKTLHIGTSDYQWFATRVSPAGPTSVSTTPSNHRFIFIFCEVRALHTRKRSARAAAYRRPPRETRFKARSQNG